MMIDMDFIVRIAGYIAAIAGAGGVVYKVVKRSFDKYMNEKITPLLKWTQNQQIDINAAAERDAILIEAQLASLEAVRDGKHNGNVTNAIAKLRKYMLNQSSKPSSYAKK